eukprot:UN11041
MGLETSKRNQSHRCVKDFSCETDFQRLRRIFQLQVAFCGQIPSFRCVKDFSCEKSVSSLRRIFRLQVTFDSQIASNERILIRLER